MSGPNSGWNPDGTPKDDADQQQGSGQPQGYKSPLEGYPGYSPPAPPEQAPMPPPYPAPAQPQYGGPIQPSYPPPPPAAPKRSQRTQWVVILVVAVLVGGGLILFRDRLGGSAADLAVGDCIDDPPGTTEIGEVQHQPCNEPHDGEVFAVITHTAAPGAAYPPTTEFQDLMSDECVPVLEIYTGSDLAALVSAGYDFSAFYPNGEGWDNGARKVTCFLIKADGSQMTGSMRVGGVTPAP